MAHIDFILTLAMGMGDDWLTARGSIKSMWTITSVNAYARCGYTLKRQTLLPPATKLGQGNIFRSVCQEFCSWEGACIAVGCAWWGGMHGRRTCMVGACMAGACMAGGHVWWGHAWWGVMHGRGCAWQGACMAGGHVWQGGCVADTTRYCQ